MSVSTLQLWLRRVRLGRQCKRRNASVKSATAAVSLLEVDIEGGAARNSSALTGYEVEMRRGARLRFSSGFVEEEVRRLLRLLEEVG
jgi:hypothetical protein